MKLATKTTTGMRTGCFSNAMLFLTAVLNLEIAHDDKEKEFFLYSDETIVGSSTECHFAVGSDKDGISPNHVRIFRRKTGLWLESLERDKDTTIVNQRKVLGPVELLDGDTIKLSKLDLQFTLKDAC